MIEGKVRNGSMYYRKTGIIHSPRDDGFFAMYAVVSWEAMVVGMQLLKYDLLQFNKLEIAFLTLADIA